ncbi:MAG: phosphotransferase family protein [Solirubrobacteraceae bacterium]
MNDEFLAFLVERDARYRDAVVVEVESIAGGYSREMRLVTIEVAGRAERLVVRSDPPAGLAMIETDRQREWEILRALNEAGIGVAPVARWFDSEGAITGAPALVLEYVAGGPWSAIAEADPAALAGQLGRLAAQVHAVPSPHAAGPVLGWSEYIDGRVDALREIERAFPGSDPVLRYVAAWLETNRPVELPLSLIHGDFQVPNVLVRAGGDLALVDWELARVGDPREDLGYLGFVGSITGGDPLAGHYDALYEAYRTASGLGPEVIDRRSVAFFGIISAIDGLRRVMEPLGVAARVGNVPSQLAYASVGITALQAVLFRATAGVGR